MVLQALWKIEVDVLESMDASDEMDRKFEYSNYFFWCIQMDMYKKRDAHFIYDLASNTTWMVLEENLNEETLTAQESK